MPLVWKTNATDPYKSLHMPIVMPGETYAQAVQRDRDFYDKFIKGRPQATSTYTTEELEAMGMVGLYEDTGE